MKLKHWPMLEVSHLYAWQAIFRVKHGWISDGLSSNIMTILIVFDGHRLPNPSGGSWAPDAQTVHQHTQQDLWQKGLMKMKVTLNISHGLTVTRS